jgi:Flp pilus assembly pilin Flp
MKKLKQFANQLWNDESGQGTAEYVLLIAIVVGLLVTLGPRIKQAINDKMGEVEGGFGEIK